MEGDAFLDWTKPYSVAQLHELLRSNYPDSTALVIGEDCKTVDHKIETAVVECPKGIWAAWRLNGTRTGRVSIAIKDEYKDMLHGYVEAQKKKLGDLVGVMPHSIEVVRVPGVTNIMTESGPAAIFNVHWLSVGKKRSHPGPSAYLDIRTVGYFNFIGKNKTDA